jgi:hypothetical protein
MGLEFETAVKRRASDEPVDKGPRTIFEVSEYDEDTDELIRVVECTAYNPGTDAIVMLFADATGRRSDTKTKAVGVIDFFFSTLDDETNDYLYRRLIDPDDPLTLEDISGWTLKLIEEWGGRPTKQPSDFAHSRKTGGRRSTPRTSPSTPSRSRSTASSTRSTSSSPSTSPVKT